MDIKDMIKKAAPAKSRLLVRSQTIRAIMAAGRKKSRTLTINMIMMSPIIKRISNKTASNSGSKPKKAKKGVRRDIS